MRGSGFGSVRMWALAGASVAAIASPAWAQDAVRRFDIPSQSMASALEAFGRQSETDILFDRAEVQGLTSAAVTGSYTPETALRRLVGRSDLIVRRVNGTAFIVERPDRQRAANDSDPTALGDIVVTGSRIRGAPPVSPVISITDDEMRLAGQTDLGAVIRSIPQNFTGGQNPTVRTGGEGSGNTNLNSGSQLNLRGLGADATLTLLNGRRLAYDGAGHGVDISSVPTIAVQRLEIVTDGTSALYGSDAIAGVANIILKRGYEGLTTSLGLGGTTSGGGDQQQASALAGTTWTGGNFMIAADYQHVGEVTNGDRDITKDLYPSGTLYPETEYYGIVASAAQHLGAGVTFTIDALYSERTGDLQNPYSVSAPATTYGAVQNTEISSYFVSPAFKFGLPHDWSAEVAATFGEDDTFSRQQVYSGGNPTSLSETRFRNATEVVEANAEGPVLALNAGAIRLAVGGGYRRSEVLAQRPAETEAARESIYAYGELYVPLASETAPMGLIRRAFLTAAARAEDYKDFGDVFTPKFGLLVSPLDGVDLKLSWGRSFKAPTLVRQYDFETAVLRTAVAFGGTGFPTGATAVSRHGGNEDLKPETAESFTGTISLHPTRLPSLSVDLSYFNVEYSDRIVNPISALADYLGNPYYGELVTLNPTPAQIEAAIARTASGTISNLSGQPYDPATVVAIIDNRSRNVAKQTAEGIDLNIAYEKDLGPRGTLIGAGGGTYISLDQQLIDGMPFTSVSGTLYNVPEYRARFGLNWIIDAFSVAGYVNYTGSVDDARFGTTETVDGQTTFDATVQWTAPDGSRFSGLVLALNVQNLFDSEPDTIRNTTNWLTPFDSANYSAMGRLIGFQIRKEW